MDYKRMNIITSIPPEKTNINLLFRCDKEVHLLSMINAGEIHFSPIANWINGTGTNNDSLEGAFRCVPLEGFSRRTFDCFRDLDVMFARDKRVLVSYGVCFFGVGDDDFQSCAEMDDSGNSYKCCYIESEYLKPYWVIPTVNEYIKTKDVTRMRMAYVTHPEKLIPKIVDELLAFGFAKDEINVQPIVYIDKYKSNHYDRFPASLFYKHNKHKPENEIRVVISSQRKSIIQKFEANGCNIRVGTIQDYSDILDLPYQDLQIRKVDKRIVFENANRFFMVYSSEAWIKLCDRASFIIKKGLSAYKHQRIELEVISQILFDKYGISVNKIESNNGSFEVEFVKDGQVIYKIVP